VDNAWVLVMAGSIISAAAVFIYMQFRRVDDQQHAQQQILKISTEYESTKTKLLGYTKFADYLTPAKQHLVDRSKSLTVHVVREYAHLERFYRDKHKIKTDLSVLGKFTVEFTLAIDLRPEKFELVVEGTGMHIKCSQPVLQAAPVLKASSHEVSVSGVLADERPFFSEVTQKFTDQAQRHGLALAREEPVRALCKAKVIDCLRDFLSSQAGVRQIPTIVVVFR